MADHGHGKKGGDKKHGDKKHKSEGGAPVSGGMLALIGIAGIVLILLNAAGMLTF